MENIIIDKVTTQSASMVKKIDTSAPMEMGMAAGTDEEGYGKTSELAVQAVCKGIGAKGGWNEVKERVPTGVYRNTSTAAKGEKGANRGGKEQWSQTGGKKGGKGQEKGGKGDSRVCWNCGKTGHLAANCTNLNAVDEDKGDISEEVREHEDSHKLCSSMAASEITTTKDFYSNNIGNTQHQL